MDIHNNNSYEFTALIGKDEKSKSSKKQHKDEVVLEKDSTIVENNESSQFHQTIANSSINAETSSSYPGSIEPNINLSKDELLKLLSVFEGELQARDEVIAILKSECSQSTEMRYGLSSQPLKALQRDSVNLDITSQDHVCEQTKEQLKKIIQNQKQAYKKLKQLHSEIEEKYQKISIELDEEKRKSKEYMVKSDDFVNLIENDRERLKQIFEQDKSAYVRKERELSRKLKDNKEEVARLKALSIELVEDRQQQLQAYNEQKQLVATLEKQVKELQSKMTGSSEMEKIVDQKGMRTLLPTEKQQKPLLRVQEAENNIKIEKEHSFHLENDLEEQTNIFYQQQEALSIKLTSEKARSKELEEKVKSLGRQMQKLKCVDKNLRKTDDHLGRIKEKLEQEEKLESLLEEVELLRQTVSDMREAEKIYSQSQEDSKDLREALDKELTQTKLLRDEVDKLKKSMKNTTEMERCVEEAMFRFDEMQQMYEIEYNKQNNMKKELEEYRLKLQKIDESEVLLQLNENKIKQMQTYIQNLKEERNGFEIKLKLEKEKTTQYKEMMEEDRIKISEFTQKVITESKKVLKAKEQIALIRSKHQDETKDINKKLEEAKESILQMITKEKAKQMENVIKNLRKQVTMLRNRLDQLENESGDKDEEVKMAKEETDTAKRNLKKSTDHLKRLVSLGIGERLIPVKSKGDVIKNVQTTDVNDENFQKDVNNLERYLEGNKQSENVNNNNVCLKGISVSHAGTQTYDDIAKNGNNFPLRLSRPQSLSADAKLTGPRRTTSLSRRDLSNDRSRAPFKVGTPSSRRSSSTSSTKRVRDKTDLSGLPGKTLNNEAIVDRLKLVNEPISTKTTESLGERASAFRSTTNYRGRNLKSSAKVVEGRKTLSLSSSDSTTIVSSRPPISIGNTSNKNKFSSKFDSTNAVKNSAKAKKSLSNDRCKNDSSTNIPKFRAVSPHTSLPSTDDQGWKS